jgi:hypothetical protein
MMAEEKRMALPDRGRYWSGGSEVRIIAAASSPCGHFRKANTRKAANSSQIGGFDGRTLHPIYGIKKQTEIRGELSGVE